MMSKGYCDEHGYEIQLLDYLIPIEGSGEAYVPYIERDGSLSVC